MSARNWQPGDVAMIPGCGPRVMTERGWATAQGNFVKQGQFQNARPLVVIDPEDREQVERLVEGFSDELIEHTQNTLLGPVVRRRDAMQATLRNIANPTPPIEEPTGWLAAVLDKEGDKWVRDGMSGDRSQSGHWWNYTVAAEKNYDGTLRADWHAIQVVRVLSEGVPAEAKS